MFLFPRNEGAILGKALKQQHQGTDCDVYKGLQSVYAVLGVLMYI